MAKISHGQICEILKKHDGDKKFQIHVVETKIKRGKSGRWREPHHWIKKKIIMNHRTECRSMSSTSLAYYFRPATGSVEWKLNKGKTNKMEQWRVLMLVASGAWSDVRGAVEESTRRAREEMSKCEKEKRSRVRDGSVWWEKNRSRVWGETVRDGSVWWEKNRSRVWGETVRDRRVWTRDKIHPSVEGPTCHIISLKQFPLKNNTKIWNVLKMRPDKYKRKKYLYQKYIFPIVNK
jgi:hypothetical protein